MGSVDKVLKFHIFAFKSLVDLAHVQGMISMIVISRCVLNDWSNPNGGETQCLDIVEFFNQALEVATPFGVLIGYVACMIAVPAVGVVARITIVEACSHGKVDGLVAKVGSPAHKGGCRPTHKGCASQNRQA